MLQTRTFSYTVVVIYKQLLILGIVTLALLTGCSGSSGSDSEAIVNPKVYVSSPDRNGRVTITGTRNVLPGNGSVTGVNLAKLGPSKSAPDCVQDTSQATDDGSFYSLSICAEVGDSIKLTYSENEQATLDVGTFNVPAFIAEACEVGERAFAISNNSSQEIWLGVTAGTISCLSDSDCPTGAAGLCTGANPVAGVAGTCGCQSNSDCGTISQCNTDNKFCYWNLPQLSIGQMDLLPGTKTLLCFPAPQSGVGIQWSGNMFARTQCDSSGQNCKTGDCNSAPNKPCPVGTGGNPPNTLLEFTLSNQSTTTTNPDFYDISIINGINVAASFGPTAGTFKATSNDPYSCATPGSTSTQGQLEACSWVVTPTVSGVDRTVLLRNVDAKAFASPNNCPNGTPPNSLGFCECAVDTDCNSLPGLVCGLALNAKKNQQYTQACGTQIGWWTADQICGSSINNTAPFVPFGEPLNCATTFQNSDGTTSTYTNLHICTKPADAGVPEQAQSCYNNAAVTDCCGCATSKFADNQDWPSVVSSSFGGPDNGCYSHNATWTNVAQPWLVFLKKACPTAYTYPFDDATSTFTCQGDATAGPPTYEVNFFDTK